MKRMKYVALWSCFAIVSVVGWGCGSSDDSLPAKPDSGVQASEAGTDSQGSIGAGDGGVDGPADATPDSHPPPSNLPDQTKYVDPLIGTASSNAPNPVTGGAGGSTFPGAVFPFGMVQWSPDTPTAQPSGYGYQDTTITGFSLTHFDGAGCANNGDLPILPSLDASAKQISFLHSKEHASPGYYDVTSTDSIRVELTATPRTGFGRFTFPAPDAPVILIDATRTATASTTTGDVRAVGEDELSGFTTGGNFCTAKNSYILFFSVKFDRAWKSADIQAGKAAITFDPAVSSTVKMKVGISYVSQSNAVLNLQTENPLWDFEGIRDTARAAWNARLNAIQATAGTDTASVQNLTKFYTALYHSMISPNTYNDVNGQYRGFDNTIHMVDPGRTQYANFSGWDIYRSQVQLLAFLFPDVASDIAQSLVVDAMQCGSFPKWSQNNDETNVMVGDPGSLVVSNIYAFGGQHFDTATALATMKKTGFQTGVTCNAKTTLPGLNDYMAYGYVTGGGGEWGPASTTLEYSSRDFAVAQFAKTQNDPDTSRILLGRSANWLNELNPNGLIEQRNTDGTWLQPLDGPADGQNAQYVEGDAEQYTWMIPHDPRTLFDKLGGNATVIPRLDRFFTKLNAGLKDPNFYMGNEPNFATPWLYDWSGSPSRTQDVVRRIIEEQFTTAPGGLPGNDDLGAMSSWLVFAALGLYPQIPGIGGFVVGTPLFPKAIVHMGNGNTLTINAPDYPKRYIQSATLNGAPTTKLWVPLDTMQNDATFAFVLGDTASTWGTGPSDAPPSFGPGTWSSVGDAMDNDGIGNDGSAGSNFDGVGWSYSSQALATAGASAVLMHGGVTFAWPSGSAAVDNVIANGQTIAFSTTQVGGRLAWLGAASNGASTGSGTFHYTDGTSSPFTMTMTDWTLQGGTALVTPGSEIAFSMPYRNHGTARDNTMTYVFFVSTPFDTTRTIASVTLPATVSAGRMHIFAVSVAP